MRCARPATDKRAKGTRSSGPALEGQNDWYLVHQLDLFKTGLRGRAPQDVYGAQMKPMATTLATEQAVMDVVAYINTLK